MPDASHQKMRTHLTVFTVVLWMKNEQTLYAALSCAKGNESETFRHNKKDNQPKEQISKLKADSPLACKAIRMDTRSRIVRQGARQYCRVIASVIVLSKYHTPVDVVTTSINPSSRKIQDYESGYCAGRASSFVKLLFGSACVSFFRTDERAQQNSFRLLEAQTFSLLDTVHPRLGRLLPRLCLCCQVSFCSRRRPESSSRTTLQYV